MSKPDNDLRLDAIRRFLAPVFSANVLSRSPPGDSHPESPISKQPLILTFASRQRALQAGGFVFPPPFPSSAITPAASS